jgi:iron only hydrogenase large subunit-like protein
LKKLTPVISVDEEKCVNCHACISVCPVKYCIDGSGDYVSINHDLCIGCGSCIPACRHDARDILDDTAVFLDALSRNEKIVAVAAPAVASSFPDRYLNLNGYLKNLGVSAVFDVSFGAELTVRSYLEYVGAASPPMVFAQPCPAIVTYIEIYQPELMQDLAPAHSPMLHTVGMIREYYPEYRNHAIAVLSSCAAKRREFDETGWAEYNVTYKALHAHLEHSGVNLGSYPEAAYASPLPERAVLFSSPGGLKQTVLRENPSLDSRIRKIEGSHTVYEYLQTLPSIKKRGIQPLLVDCLNCELGCNGGPGTLNQDAAPDELEHLIETKKEKMQQEYGRRSIGRPNYRKKINSVISRYWKPGIYDRSYQDLSGNNTVKIPSQDELATIYRSMRKIVQTDFKNCSSCGYGTCEGMAVAIFNGLNKAENCHYYQRFMIEEDHRKYQEIAVRLDQEIRTSRELIATINRAIDSLNDKGHNQYASLEQSSASIEEMVSAIESSSRVAVERQSAIMNLIETARTGEADLEMTVSGIEGIARSVETIGEMIEVINSVASGTNLLSMNAAIEAAHAGDAGRGFSVVATEIRNLAERTSENARSISASLKEIIQGITDAAQTSRRTGQTVSDIIREIVDVADGFTQVSDSLSEMSVGSNQILDALKDLKEISSEVRDSHKEMSDSIGSMQAVMESISGISGESVSHLNA